MWRRGADSDGYVANFVETEQILQLNGYTASFVQVSFSLFSVSFPFDNDNNLTSGLVLAMYGNYIIG